MQALVNKKISEFKENLNILQQQKQQILVNLNELEVQIQRLIGAASGLEQLLIDLKENESTTETKSKSSS